MKRLGALLAFLLVFPAFSSPFVLAACTDTDNGLDYYVRGTAADVSGSKTDTCADGGKNLTEYFCLNGTVRYLNYNNCNYGCSNGACIPLDYINLSVSALKQTYGINEQINLTDPPETSAFEDSLLVKLFNFISGFFTFKEAQSSSETSSTPGQEQSLSAKAEAQPVPETSAFLSNVRDEKQYLQDLNKQDLKKNLNLSKKQINEIANAKDQLIKQTNLLKRYQDDYKISKKVSDKNKADQQKLR